MFSVHNHTSAAICSTALKMAGLLVAALLLAGCPGIAAVVPGQPNLADLPVAVSTGEAGQGWVAAGNVTITPEPDPTQGTAEAATTPEPDPTQGTAEAATPTDDTPAQSSAVQFVGTVESAPSGNSWEGAWRIGGHTVYVSPSTVVNEQQGALGVGAQVEVEGWSRPDGSVDAGWIHVISGAPAGTPTAAVSGPNVTPPAEGTQAAPATATAIAVATFTAQPVAQHSDNEAENETSNQNSGPHLVVFRGVIDSLPASGLVGDWRVGGRLVHVGAGTRIRHQQWALAPGALVQIHGWQQSDGSINAASIDTKNPRSAGGPDHPGNGNGRGNGKGNGNGNGNGNGGND